MKRNHASRSHSADSYWSGLTDEELLTISFTTEDPESLPGLVFDLPAINARPIVEYAYNFRGTKRGLIRCAHCKYPNHREGFVIKVDENTRFLCGHNCGKKIYGVDFDMLRSEFSLARSRQLSLLRMNKLREKLPSFNSYIFELRTSAGMAGFKNIKTEFRKNMPRLHGALDIVTRRWNLELHLEREVRDYKAEERAQNQYEKDLQDYNSATAKERSERHMRPPTLSKKPMYKMDPYLFGSIPTATLFTEDCFKKSDFDALASQFAALEHSRATDDSGGHNIYRYQGKRDQSKANRVDRVVNTTHDIDRMLMDANTLLEKLDKMLGKYQELALFFEYPVLSLVAEWATKRADIPGFFKAFKGGLTFIDEDGKEASVSLPQGFTLAERQPLRAFKDAINSSI
jgi:hypothetical protein